MNIVLRSKRVFSNGQISPADVIIDHDCIAGVVPHGSTAEALDLGEKLVTSGFVDLHSDAVEKEIEPRPGAAFPVENALVELDKKLAMAGITTMFHAIAFNDEALVGRRGTETSVRLIEQIAEANTELLSIDNMVHGRFEITSSTSVDQLKRLMDEAMIHILSFMDHSPGQGQFKTLEKWKQYHIPVFELSDEDAGRILSMWEERKKACLLHIQELAEHARQHSIILASHDDDSPAKIDLMESLGVRIAEFPLCLETAQYARAKKMTTGMGAPNIVRGKSQSGNISAHLLVEQGSCDFLCSDYHPSSMLQAVYCLHRQHGFPLAEALHYVSTRPAAIAGLGDRGEIAAGKLADLLVIDDRHVANVVMTIKSGNPVYSGSSCLYSPALA